MFLARRRDDKPEVRSGAVGQDQEELKEESLTRLRATHSKGLADYKVADGEF